MKRRYLILLLLVSGCAFQSAVGPLSGKQYSNYHYYPNFPPEYYQEIYVHEHPGLSEEMKSAILGSRLMAGMTKEQVKLVVDYAHPINTTHIQGIDGKLHVHEQWTARDCPPDNPYACWDVYCYFEDGILTAWQD